jgi:6-pyruvoyltetrahydropterin/6-carboxytetrahydropterin synthase
MLTITKIFRFEMAHALYGYNGACEHLHGHSYELHVSLKGLGVETYIKAPGLLMDFKELKQLINSAIIERLDHKLCLSEKYIQANNMVLKPDNLMLFPAEPSVENLLIYIRNELMECLPPYVQLQSLRLFETRDSYAEWINN